MIPPTSSSNSLIHTISAKELNNHKTALEFGFLPICQLFQILVEHRVILKTPENGTFALANVCENDQPPIINEKIYKIFHEQDPEIQFIRDIISQLADQNSKTHCYSLENLKIAGSYAWKLIASDFEAFKTFFEPDLEKYIEDKHVLNSWIQLAFDNLQSNWQFKDNQADIHIYIPNCQVGDPEENIEKIKSIIDLNPSLKLGENYLQSDGSSSIIIAHKNIKAEFFFTSFNSPSVFNAQSFSLQFDKEQIFFNKLNNKTADLLAAICGITLPNNYTSQNFINCMGSSFVVAKGYLNAMINNLFTSQSNLPKLYESDFIAQKAAKNIQKCIAKNDAYITYEILKAELASNDETQNKFSTLWNSLQTLFVFQKIDDYRAVKVLNWLKQDELLSQLDHIPLFKLLANCSPKSSKNEYTCTDLFSMVQIFAFLYSPESATIIQEPLQFVIQKEINIKFLANLDRSAENLQQFLSQERDLEILSALSEIFAQNFDDKDRSKFYDFIFKNCPDSTAIEISKAATKLITTPAQKFGIHLLLAVHKHLPSKSVNQSLKFFIQHVLNTLETDTKNIKILYTLIARSHNLNTVNIEDDPNRLHQPLFWLEFLCQNRSFAELEFALSLENISWSKKDYRHIFTLLSSIDNQIAIPFLIKNFNFIDLKPHTMIFLLDQHPLLLENLPETSIDIIRQYIDYTIKNKDDLRFTRLLSVLIRFENKQWALKLTAQKILDQKNLQLEIPTEIKWQVDKILPYIKMVVLDQSRYNDDFFNILIEKSANDKRNAALDILLFLNSPFTNLCYKTLQKLKKKIKDEDFDTYKLHPDHDAKITIQKLQKYSTQENFVINQAQCLRQFLELALINPADNQQLLQEIAEKFFQIYQLPINMLAKYDVTKVETWIKILGKTTDKENKYFAKIKFGNLQPNKNTKLQILSLVPDDSNSKLDNESAVKLVHILKEIDELELTEKKLWKACQLIASIEQNQQLDDMLLKPVLSKLFHCLVQVIASKPIPNDKHAIFINFIESASKFANSEKIDETYHKFLCNLSESVLVNEINKFIFAELPRSAHLSSDLIKQIHKTLRSFFAANSKENFFWATKQWEKIDKDSQYHYQFVKKIINDKLEGYDEIVIDYLNAPLSQNIHPIKDVICTAFELIIKSNDYPTIIEWAINPPETISLVPSQKKKLMTRAIVLIESKKKFVRINELLKSLINYYNEYPETYNGSILIKFFSKVYEFQSLNLSLDHKIFLITNILKSIKTLKKYDPLVEKNFNTLLYTTLEEFSQDSSKQDNYFSFSLLLIEWVVNHPEITSLELKNIKHPLQCALAMIFNTKKHNFIKLGQFFIPILNHHQKSSQLISLKKVIQFLNKIPDISSIQINIDNKIFLVDQIIKNMNLFGKKSTQAQQNFQKLVASILTEFSEDRVKNEKCRSLIIQIIDLATKNKLFHIPEIFTDSIELNLFSKSVNIENLNSYVTALQKYYPNNLQKTVRLLDKITDKKITDLKFNIKKSVVKHLLENLDVFENNHAQAKQNLQRLTRSLLIYFSNDKNKQVENHELFELIKINSIKILAYNYSSSDTDDLVASVMCKIGSFYDELEPPTRNGYEILYENALIFSQVNQHMSSDQFFLTLKALLKLYLYLPFSNNSSFDHKSIGCLDNLLLYNSVDSATSICKFLSVLLHYTLQSRRLDTYTDNRVNDLINLITIKVTNIVATEKKISAQFEIIIKQIYQILSLDYLSNKNRLDDKYSTNINTLNALDKIIHKKKKDISLMNRWISDRNKLLTEGIKLNLECDILKLYYLVDDEFAKIQNIISFSNKLTRMIEYGEFVQTPNLIKYLTISSTQLDESTWKKIFLIFLPVFLKVYLKVENQPDYISKILNSFLKDLSNSVTSDQRGLVSSRIEQANQYFNLMENSIDEFNKLLAKEKIDTIINLIILQIFGPNIDLK